MTAQMHDTVENLDTARWACPHANLVLRADAPREEWLAARRQGIGGSDASAILGVNKYSSAYQVWLDKTGRGTEKEETMAMRMGNLLEPIVVQLFEEETGIRTRRAGLMRSKEHAYLQVSVDRLTADGGLLECKTSNGFLSHEWEDGQVPDHAELQVQHGLAVTGRSHAWVAGLLDGREFFVRRIDRDEDLIRIIIEQGERFWHDHVLADEAPAVTAVDYEPLKARFRTADEGAAVTVDRTTLVVLRAEYEAAHEAEKTAVEQKKEAAAKIRELAKEADTLKSPEGEVFFTIKQNGVFSASQFEKEHPDIAKSFLVPTEKLDAKKLQENHPELHKQYRARTLRLPKLKTNS
ncbi:YqaJ viral recombinase family nuclease [Nesterenkonia flava]|uniref:YqaJ viral recombinase family protein n=1 Tax=Nesterenkonia flava TaxID=469799 RepID=A0ABU1FWA2_9MICC|nr:YqaJ viral recombinase family protein [Nesterenkonia flava]MDR5712960.1 YqaJ viral recombinase family protein [Nesterenkonia flava]